MYPGSQVHTIIRRKWDALHLPPHDHNLFPCFFIELGCYYQWSRTITKNKSNVQGFGRCYTRIFSDGNACETKTNNIFCREDWKIRRCDLALPIAPSSRLYFPEKSILSPFCWVKINIISMKSQKKTRLATFAPGPLRPQADCSRSRLASRLGRRSGDDAVRAVFVVARKNGGKNHDKTWSRHEKIVSNYFILTSSNSLYCFLHGLKPALSSNTRDFMGIYPE